MDYKTNILYVVEFKTETKDGFLFPETKVIREQQIRFDTEQEKQDILKTLVCNKNDVKAFCMIQVFGGKPI